MSSLDLTRDWLKNVLKPYSARDRLLEDVLSVLRDRRGLAVKTEAFSRFLSQIFRSALTKSPQLSITVRRLSCY